MKNKTAIIAGASQGLGSELASVLLLQGYALALIARNSSKLEEVRRKLQQLSPSSLVTTHTCDLADDQAVNKAFFEIKTAHRNCVALFNTAATWINRIPAKELTGSLVRAGMDLNFTSIVNSTSGFLKLPRPENEKLTIINIGASASLQGWPELATFCAAKSALRSYSQSLARELAPEGIHVSHVIVDGLLDNERTIKLNPNTGAEDYIKQASLIQTLIHLMNQDRSCWTFELDVRPHSESW